MSILDFLIFGVLGGLTPGPITALMLGETLKHGFRRGAQVPLALIISNVFFAIFHIALVSWGQNLDLVLTTLRYLGGLVLIYFGICELRSNGDLSTATAPNPFKKALLMEITNPHPYIIWTTVLAVNLVIPGQNFDLLSALPKVATFVAGLVGTKLVIAMVVASIKDRLRKCHILWLNRIIGLALIIFAIQLMLG